MAAMLCAEKGNEFDISLADDCLSLPCLTKIRFQTGTRDFTFFFDFTMCRGRQHQLNKSLPAIPGRI